MISKQNRNSWQIADDATKNCPTVALVRGRMEAEAMARAGLILRAVDAFDDLLAACEAIASLSDGQGRRNLLEVAGQARIAIAKAKAI